MRERRYSAEDRRSLLTYSSSKPWPPERPVAPPREPRRKPTRLEALRQSRPTKKALAESNRVWSIFLGEFQK